MSRAVAIAGLALLALACNEPTQLFVVVQSDMDVPAELDAVRIEVTGSETMTASGSLSGSRAVPLPRTVGVVQTGGELGPLTVRAVGSLRGTDVVERVARTSFLPGETRVLTLGLSRGCVGAVCGAGQTCSAGVCVSAEVSPSSLPTYTGGVPRFDAGFCPPETCDGTDNDCDGRVDEGFMLQTNPNSCGQCGRVCEFAHAGASCVGGQCVMGACDPGFDDCNQMDVDGCERALNTLADCGRCNQPCEVTGGTATCGAGTCQVMSCDAGLGDCDADAATGCEQTLDTLTHCGACGAPCARANATASCGSGSCELVACDAGFGDCNGDPSDGCEASLDTLTDCGGCGVACAAANATATCATGACEVDTCDMWFADCDPTPMTGCETETRRDPANCGGCGIVCTAPTDRCVNGSCQ